MDANVELEFKSLLNFNRIECLELAVEKEKGKGKGKRKNNSNKVNFE